MIYFEVIGYHLKTVILVASDDFSKIMYNVYYRHWIAVFGFVFKRETEEHVKKLEEWFRKEKGSIFYIHYASKLCSFQTKFRSNILHSCYVES